MRLKLHTIGLLMLALLGAAQAIEKPLTPQAAQGKVDQVVLVEMVVKATKNRLEKKGEIYLDSEEDFNDEKNLGIVIDKSGSADLKTKGIDDPAEYFKEKKIRVNGTIKKQDGRYRIVVSEAKQIEEVKP